MEEPLLLEYHNEEGLFVVEKYMVPVHWPRLRLQAAINRAIDYAIERLKGRLVNVKV